ncbi:hypothetical protein SLEP1_g22235 [Rubroshorea leprosula]|uniref:Uncharacterized protein n=1 Tax=Rubroshorea leprosula TaxID=152421 RepID=A0AAV5JHT8_9ROSI|nr:hypothetical protein SLEP1_g22235 [Rubroshorea leprosula]
MCQLDMSGDQATPAYVPKLSFSGEYVFSVMFWKLTPIINLGRCCNAGLFSLHEALQPSI